MYFTIHLPCLLAKINIIVAGTVYTGPIALLKLIFFRFEVRVMCKTADLRLGLVCSPPEIFQAVAII